MPKRGMQSAGRSASQGQLCAQRPLLINRTHHPTDTTADPTQDGPGDKLFPQPFARVWHPPPRTGHNPHRSIWTAPLLGTQRPRIRRNPSRFGRGGTIDAISGTPTPSPRSGAKVLGVRVNPSLTSTNAAAKAGRDCADASENNRRDETRSKSSHSKLDVRADFKIESFETRCA